MNTLSTLQSYRALVCGASRGIGRACAQALARHGAEILLLARNEASLSEVMDSLDTSQGQQHHAVPGDMSDPEALRRTAEAASSSHGPVHILIHNSGGPAPGAVFTAEPDAFTRAFTQHVLSAQTLAQVLVPGMKKAGYGRIINIISTSVKQPIQGLGVSNTIRGAMASWSKTLATELAPSGITVNNVLPGATSTERLEAIIQTRARNQKRAEAEVEAEMKAEIPAGRFGQPEEIAAAVAFLASAQAAYINGVSLPVDGGRISSL